MEKADEQRLGAVYVSLDRLLAEADFVSLHARLTPATRHLIGARELALMKPTAFLVNTARGAIVDEAALTWLLVGKRIAGAGLDVFETEPNVDRALTELPNVALTPHLGSAVVEVREAMAHAMVDNILALIAGRRPPNIVWLKVRVSRMRSGSGEESKRIIGSQLSPSYAPHSGLRPMSRVSLPHNSYCART